MRRLAGWANWFGIVASAVVIGFAKGNLAAAAIGLLFFTLFVRDLLIAVDRENTLVEFRKHEWGSDNPGGKETER